MSRAAYTAKTLALAKRLLGALEAMRLIEAEQDMRIASPLAPAPAAAPAPPPAAAPAPANNVGDPFADSPAPRASLSTSPPPSQRAARKVAPSTLFLMLAL